MATPQKVWVRVNKHHPCAICKRTNWCTYLAGSNVARCMRLANGHTQKDGAGWIYHLDQPIPMAQVKQPERPAKTPERLDATYGRMARRWCEGEEREDRVMELAKELGVARWTLDALCCGWNGREWTFPERAPNGMVVGIGTRHQDGAKRFVVGGCRGLILIEIEDRSKPVLVLEGPSDVAAALTLGLTAVGRPSNSGGGEPLCEWLADWNGRIVVMGENDVKEDGRWPGKEGAESILWVLRRRLKRRGILMRMPLDGAKDLRRWLNQQRVDPEDVVACKRIGQSFLRRSRI